VELLGSSTNSAPAFADLVLCITLALATATEPTLRGRATGVRLGCDRRRRCRAAMGAARSGADCGADPDRAPPPLLANIYTYSNRVQPRPADQDRTALRSTANAALSRRNVGSAVRQPPSRQGGRARKTANSHTTHHGQLRVDRGHSLGRPSPGALAVRIPLGCPAGRAGWLARLAARAEQSGL
jgi:hypothetical protein